MNGFVMLLTLQAYLLLIYFEFVLKRRDFAMLCGKVARPVAAERTVAPQKVEQVCAAVDMACIWYCKEVLCLQRSAVAASLLKRCSVNAQLVVGARQIPFKAHAWVEVDGRVVNDKPYMREIYRVIDHY